MYLLRLVEMHLLRAHEMYPLKVNALRFYEGTSVPKNFCPSSLGNVLLGGVQVYKKCNSVSAIRCLMTCFVAVKTVELRALPPNMVGRSTFPARFG